MNKPILEYNSRGESGNIFWILGALLKIMRHNNKGTPWAETQQRCDEICKQVFTAKSYDEALAIIGEEVTLIDTAN